MTGRTRSRGFRHDDGAVLILALVIISVVGTGAVASPVVRLREPPVHGRVA
ncbi:MAG: hypothetical protein QOI21_2153 [Actinomycetota bacterium]|jgi:hypothetical protein|nr:hypothetical protein [Actinomycetota bacterium]